MWGLGVNASEFRVQGSMCNRVYSLRLRAVCVMVGLKGLGLGLGVEAFGF